MGWQYNYIDLSNIKYYITHTYYMYNKFRKYDWIDTWECDFRQQIDVELYNKFFALVNFYFNGSPLSYIINSSRVHENLIRFGSEPFNSLKIKNFWFELHIYV